MDEDFGNPLMGKRIPDSFGHLEPALELTEHELRIARTHAKTLF